MTSDKNHLKIWKEKFYLSFFEPVLDEQKERDLNRPRSRHIDYKKYLFIDS